jgi:hypothetical protein
VMPGAVGVEAQVQRLGAGEKRGQRFGVQLVDPELLGRCRRGGWCGGGFGRGVSRRSG